MGWLVLAALAGCAREIPPPGGPEDRMPPRLVATTPEPFAIVPGQRRPVVFEFDERISERGLDDAVVVSPITGETRVRHRRSSLEVSVAGGWRPHTVYRVMLRPRVQDLFGNRMSAPVEVVFSTGPAIPDGALAGLVADRITGRPVAGARVEALEQATRAVHLAITDSSGYFDLPHLAAGHYDVTAYIDQSRNRRLDPFEPRDVAAIQLGVGDTAVARFAVLAPDTTPARLAQAEPRDSVRVRLTFDDHLDPDWPAERAGVLLWALTDTAMAVRDSIAVPVDSLRHPWQADLRPVAAADTTAQGEPPAERPSPDDARTPREPREPRELREPPPAARADDRRARREVVEPERARPDEEPLIRRGRPGAPEAEREPPARVETAADTVAAVARQVIGHLPTRELVLFAGAPLEPGRWYRVSVSGVVNISGLPDGGGSVLFQVPVPPPPPQMQEEDAGIEEEDAEPEPEPAPRPEPEPRPEPGAQPQRP